LVNCDGIVQTIVNAKSCSIPITSLLSEPWLLVLTDSVYAKIQAVNLYGSSIASLAGNGAILYRVPEAPFNLTENLAQRSNSTLGFTWSTGFIGGTPIIDFTVQSD
jgi:hypothetical protein